MSLQDRLEALKTLPPAKLSARMPSWYKTHQRNCAGADCLSTLPEIKPYPVFVVKPPTLGAADSVRPLVFVRMALELESSLNVPKYSFPSGADVSKALTVLEKRELTTAEYIRLFEEAAQLKGANHERH